MRSKSGNPTLKGGGEGGSQPFMCPEGRWELHGPNPLQSPPQQGPEVTGTLNFSTKAQRRCWKQRDEGGSERSSLVRSSVKTSLTPQKISLSPLRQISERLIDGPGRLSPRTLPWPHPSFGGLLTNLRPPLAQLKVSRPKACGSPCLGGVHASWRPAGTTMTAQARAQQDETPSRCTCGMSLNARLQSTESFFPEFMGGGGGGGGQMLRL